MFLFPEYFNHLFPITWNNGNIIVWNPKGVSSAVSRNNPVTKHIIKDFVVLKNRVADKKNKPGK